MPLIPITLPVTPAKINFNVKNTKYPAAHAPAMGKPTSATNLKKSIFMLPVKYYAIFLI
jgi:hypothetical protein